MLIIITLVLLLCQLIQSIPIYKRDSMSGEGTYYKVGLGSCGGHNSDDELVAALASRFMEGGQNCGKTITVHGKSGASVDVKIVDTCPGCADGDVDMSETAFKKLAPLDDGRIPITWSL